MTNGLSASVSCCTHVLVMVLDDIGTKSKVPPLAPTWIMETSPGNFQWGYVLSVQPLCNDFAAAIRAIAEAGYTDEGAINAVRNFRIPGSVNLKEGRNNFASILTEFHPDREFTLGEICAALGVTPAAADTTTARAVTLDDDGTDDVLAWLSEAGHLTARGNAAGWWGVVCPNSEAHTTGETEGRYMPVNRAYTCLHAHCAEWTSARFLAWVAEQGGPTGLRGFSPSRRDARQDTPATCSARIGRRLPPRAVERGWAVERRRRALRTTFRRRSFRLVPREVPATLTASTGTIRKSVQQHAGEASVVYENGKRPALLASLARQTVSRDGEVTARCRRPHPPGPGRDALARHWPAAPEKSEREHI